MKQKPGTPGRVAEEQTAVSAAVWRILRNIYLRRVVSVPPETLDAPEQNTALDPYFKEMEGDHDQIMAVVKHAYHEGVGHVHGLLHGREGVDHEMLDQTVEYAVLALADPEDK